MTSIQIIRDYPHPPVRLWRAVTHPELVARWTVTGQGGRLVGFSPMVGTQFQFIAKPVPGWKGIVDCEVLEAEEPRVLRYTWRGGEDENPTVVTYRIDPRPDGSRFTFEHTGFTGLGGFFMAKLLGAVRKKMLTVGLPAVLDAMAKDEQRTAITDAPSDDPVSP